MRATAAFLLLGACASGMPQPAALARGESCASCRMSVADPRLAAQLVTPGEDPLFFDDIGCLRDWLKGHRQPRGSAAFVADHRTGAWVPAEHAVFVRSTRLRTPMGSQLLGYLDTASRDADPAAAGGTPVGEPQVLSALAGGRR